VKENALQVLKLFDISVSNSRQINLTVFPRRMKLFTSFQVLKFDLQSLPLPKNNHKKQPPKTNKKQKQRKEQEAIETSLCSIFHVLFSS